MTCQRAGLARGIADYRFIKPLGTGNNGVFYLANRPPRLPSQR